MINVMIDLETLGVSHEASIVQIGACVFDPWGDAWVDPVWQFIENVRSDNGRPDLRTVEWWEKKGGFYHSAPPKSLPLALLSFTKWLDSACPLEEERVIWSNGPGFDQTILNVAYDSLRTSAPWKYNSGRCCRTIFNMATYMGWTRPERGVAHNGLQDSLDQAKEVWQAIQFVRSQPQKGK
jgi:exodeoxyribonuclease VIII